MQSQRVGMKEEQLQLFFFEKKYKIYIFWKKYHRPTQLGQDRILQNVLWQKNYFPYLKQDI
jgi:hypothetical protein